MKFPGQRKIKHYFPVSTRKTPTDLAKKQKIESHICGIDQTLVDIEAPVDDAFLTAFDLIKGTSCLVDDQQAEAIYHRLLESDAISHEFAGGTIGNTLHNFSVLSDDRSVLFGVISDPIRAKGYAYKYLCNTSSKVDLDLLQPVSGPIGRCFTLISEDGERTFAFNRGMANALTRDNIDHNVIAKSSALVISSYLMRVGDGDTIDDATMQAVAYANEHSIPVVLSLGTKQIIAQDPQWWLDFIKSNVTVLAMNEEEAETLTGESDPLLASQQALNVADLVLLTAGPDGLYLSGYTDCELKRTTTNPLKTASLSDFNQFEFSRAMRFEDCRKPIMVFSHIEPYMGGPAKIKNTNGAGDGALSALLHDMAANHYHRQHFPNSSKHLTPALTYSSFAQVCKYSNRVSFEMLNQHSPRLSKGLPEKEDSLEEAYWEQ
ncbi:inosine/guanosine kinase [Psychrobium sp. 1_MG-2023]|uniref:inosine/guanosine kinase n=1 Tax=Psychrobium sp. 1_MG-2023 TaxID=3062624 RepID=UPI000C3498EC|nr:inosine/guanosine kinase [Psychrobium sp. 1_MG-2023]MDP2560302.1 inosine/guanosine kinase [Psychrobium sp. 1_MG-2023]PKF55418.1 inosine/guanosine kinase [Alteromonadales bacterium alter-6D02]